MTSLPPTLVVGCGLIGTSVALALREHGIDVHLSDRDPEHVAAAVERGAGSADPVHGPALVVVAVPPRATAAAVREALETYPAAVVTDVASVKGSVAREVAGGAGLDRYVGSHPMAGSERSGPLAASARLFEGRPWVITPAAGATDAAVRLVEEVAVMLGAVPTVMDADTHDRAVALVSHVPQVLSTLTAARLVDAPPAHLALAGQGLRDVTRVAGSDPALWRDIITTNAAEIGAVLTAVRDDLDTLIDALRDRDVVGGVLEAGRVGTRAIPGKHGGEPVELVVVNVQVPDTPGALSRLFAHVGESGVNIEDLRIDHELGRPVGLVEIAVAADRADELVARLTERAWSAYR
ncbi:prephenate dehydrogenase [Aeromicrobium sp. SORGH_AS981]|uniref:prephenate dehydrogenase n=1 Tax=Aeromicrobium sp. SORGH_AS_0981 TaxID=3041802 RepID=UPI0028601E62|nr:prephenate dehydrogenase [Aeromicrobium sp. SORGH_AS_0981]MDR6118857.1 prephenate dehydrogenase [Aeromicrobium sp. SORGH_AS_0981]